MSQRITIPHSDKLGSLLLIAFSIAMLVLSGRLATGRTPKGDPGPAFFPILIVAGIILLVLFQLARSVRNDDEIRYEIPVSTAKSVTVVATLLFGYVFFLDSLGFLLASFLFLVILLRYSGETDHRIIALISIGLPLLLFLVFSGVFNVPLPENELLPISRVVFVTPDFSGQPPRFLP